MSVYNEASLLPTMQMETSALLLMFCNLCRVIHGIYISLVLLTLLKYVISYLKPLHTCLVHQLLSCTWLTSIQHLAVARCSQVDWQTMK